MAEAPTPKTNRRRLFFIDANIYLSFFRTSAKDIRKLLPPLQEIKDSVFITRQIRDEVERNKLAVTLESLEPVRDKVKWREWNLPDLLSTKFGRGAPNWSEDAKRDEEEVNKAIDLVIDEVATSKDDVSLGLEPIFQTARAETPEELEKARFRREIGNPPGKKKDTLGDQISWTQLLSHVSAKDELWIVTADGDFHIHNRKSVLLNPFLLKELEEKGVERAKIHVYDNLASALQGFSKAAKEPVKALPPDEVIESAAREEQEIERASVAVPPTGGVLWKSFPPRLVFSEGTGVNMPLFSAVGDPPWHTSPVINRLTVVDPEGVATVPVSQVRTSKTSKMDQWFPPKPAPPSKRGGKKRRKRR